MANNAILREGNEQAASKIADHASAHLIDGLSRSDWQAVRRALDEAQRGGNRPSISDSDSKQPLPPVDLTSNPYFRPGREKLDGGSRYPLPEPDPDAVYNILGNGFDRLERKITADSVQAVQSRMTPAEKAQLRQDAATYEAELERWQGSWMRHIGLNPPKAPEKPASLERYERAIDAEINKRLDALLNGGVKRSN